MTAKSNIDSSFSPVMVFINPWEKNTCSFTAKSVNQLVTNYVRQVVYSGFIQAIFLPDNSCLLRVDESSKNEAKH